MRMKLREKSPAAAPELRSGMLPPILINRAANIDIKTKRTCYTKTRRVSSAAKEVAGRLDEVKKFVKTSLSILVITCHLQ